MAVKVYVNIWGQREYGNTRKMLRGVAQFRFPSLKENFSALDMETKKFTPDEEAIGLRAQIVPFGRAAMYEAAASETTEFVVSSSEAALQTENTEAAETESAAAYVPPILHKAAYSTGNTEVTVRVSNIPQDLSSREVYDLFMHRCGKCFYRCNLVYDKETRVSRGTAYVTCTSKEKAAEFARATMAIIVDNFKLGVEILENR